MEARFENRGGKRVVVVALPDGREIVASGITDLSGKCYRAGVSGREAAAAWSRALAPKVGR